MAVGASAAPLWERQHSKEGCSHARAARGGALILHMGTEGGSCGHPPRALGSGMRASMRQELLPQLVPVLLLRGRTQYWKPHSWPPAAQCASRGFSCPSDPVQWEPWREVRKESGPWHGASACSFWLRIPGCVLGFVLN